MLSRVAENLYWMSRYVERAENVARLLDVGLYLELDAAGPRPATTARAGRERADHPRLPRGVRRAARAGTGPRRRARLPHVRPHEPAVDPRHDRAGPARTPAAPRRRSASRPGARSTGSTSTCAARRRAADGSTPARRGSSTAIKQACILFDGLVHNTLPRDEVYPLPPAGPLPRAGEHDRPDPPRQVPDASTGAEPGRRPGRCGWSTGRACCGAARPTGPTCGEHRDRVEPVGRGPLPGARRRLPAGRPVLRRPGAASRSTRSPAATTTNSASEAERLLGRLDSELRYIDVARDLRTRPARRSSTASRRPAVASARRSSRRIS